MSHLPVISSVLAPDAIREIAVTTYDLDPDSTCRIIRAGVNHTYEITGSSGTFIFRLYSPGWRNREQISEELRLVIILKEKNQPVSYPIADPSGNYICVLQAAEGPRYGVLFSYAEGEKIIYLTPELHYKAGELMASMHRQTEHIRLQRVAYTPDITIGRPLEMLRKFLSADMEEMAFMETLAETLLTIIGNADSGQLRTGAVHLDFWFDNFNISPEGKITVFDFDFCGNGWLCYDIAYYVMQLFATEPDIDGFRKKEAAFLSGYESFICPTPEEKRLLSPLGLALYFFYLGVQCERFDDWSNVFVSETYLRRYITARVKRYCEYVRTTSDLTL